MPRELSELNHKHLAYILFRVGGYTNEETANVLGMAKGTCINWAKDKKIKALRAEIEGDLREAARDYLNSLLPEIIYTMAKVMRQGTTERVRLDAATRLLDKALPQETVNKITGDPNKPILFELLKNEKDQQAAAALQELTPAQKADYADALEKLESLANTGSE